MNKLNKLNKLHCHRFRNQLPADNRAARVVLRRLVALLDYRATPDLAVEAAVADHHQHAGRSHHVQRWDPAGRSSTSA